MVTRPLSHSLISFALVVGVAFAPLPAVAVAVASSGAAAPHGGDARPTAVSELPAFRAGFGRAVAVGEFEIFAGEPTSFKDPGLVRVFRRGADGRWRETAALMGSDADVGDGFGQTLATAGSSLIVGNPGADSRSGALYAFARGSDGSWVEVERVGPAEGSEGSNLGSAIATDGRFVFAGAPGHGDGDGGVFVFRIGADGALAPAGILTGPDELEGLRFGSSLSFNGTSLAVGAPGHESGSGAVFIFDLGSDGEFRPTGMVSSPDDDGARLGLKVELDDARLVASMPGIDRANGAVAVFVRGSGDEWTRTAFLQPTSEGNRRMFGASIAIVDNSIWIGEPGADGATGAVRIYTPSDEGWIHTSSLTGDAVDERDQLGATMAVSGSVAVVGATGDAYGEGAAVVFERSGEEWHPSDFIYNAVPDLEPIVGSQVDCDDGAAADYSCANVDLVAFIPNKDIETNRGVRLNDVWGWTDPESGREFALIGTMEETVFLDLGDPQNPVYLGKLPKTPGSRGNTWRDMKTYNNYAFIVADGAGQHGMQIFDLTQLLHVENAPVVFEESAHYDGIASSHNIVINEDTGFAYTVGNSSGGESCGGALHMIDIKDPLNPQFAGCFNDSRTGNGGSGATHDAQCVIYRGPDGEHQGKEICIGSNGTAISVADVSDKANPVPISFRGYPTSGYVHQGWLTDDHRYFYQNDESDELSGKVDRTRTLVWDLADLDDPILVTEFFGPTNATDHNLYISGDYMYETNNASGLRIVDISDRENPVEFGFFDTTPYGKDVAGFNGTWSSYPYFKSGMIVVTSRREGVFIVKKRERDI